MWDKPNTTAVQWKRWTRAFARLQRRAAPPAPPSQECSNLCLMIWSTKRWHSGIAVGRMPSKGVGSLIWTGERDVHSGRKRATMESQSESYSPSMSVISCRVVPWCNPWKLECRHNLISYLKFVLYLQQRRRDKNSNN